MHQLLFVPTIIEQAEFFLIQDWNIDIEFFKSFRVIIIIYNYQNYEFSFEEIENFEFWLYLILTINIKNSGVVYQSNYLIKLT